jgi:N-acetylneuraminate synthase
MRLGVKARWTDADSMAELGLDLMEVFVGEKDLFESQQNMVETFLEIKDKTQTEFVIHNQEYWTDGERYYLVDLASEDEQQRSNAVKILKKTLDFASQIDAAHVIIHPGGVFKEKVEPERFLPNLVKSLKEINDERILLENMPWFYIMLDGTVNKSNICIDPSDFFYFEELIGGATFDICHAYLTTPEGDNKYIQDMKKSLNKMIKHVHASDAKPPHHEGLQIGDGNIDFNILTDFKVPIVPEIIDGHKNCGEGFKIAVARLRDFE